MKKPQERETTDREEMMCTLCNTEGLEAHPAYEDEYSGRASLLKATRCSNEDCDYHKGVPRDQIEMQMPDSGFGLGALAGSGISTGDILTAVFIIGGLIFVAFTFGLVPTGQDNPGETPGESVLGINGSVDSNASIGSTVALYANGTKVNQTQVSPNRTYSFSGIPPGNYTVYLLNESGYGPPGRSVVINESSNNTTVNFNSTVQTENVEINQTVGNANLILNYSNPQNVRGFSLELSPVEGENLQRGNQLSTSREENIIMPVFPREQQLRVNAEFTTEEFIDNRIYSGSPQTYEIKGNANASSLEIALTNQTGSDAKSRTVDVTGGSETQTITVNSNQTLGDVRVTLKNGTSQDRKQSSGVWNGQDNITLVTGTSGFTDGQVTVTPKPVKTNESINGEISGSSISHSFEGNTQPEDGVISFIGGDAQAAITGSANLSISAENGTTDTKVSEVARITDSGSYRIEWESSIERNESLVNFTYQVNGKTTIIDRLDGGKSLDLQQGDIVNITAKAQRPALSDTSSPPTSARTLNDNIKIKSVNFEPQNPSPGDVVSVTITLENVGNTEVTDTVELYQNGEQFSSTQVTLGIGETKELGPRDIGQPSVNEEGTHVWFVNQRGPYFLEVGDVTTKYGAGSISAELRDVESQGRVQVDTNGDGEFDCDVLARGGSCELGTLQPGQNAFTVNQSGVTNTEYVIEYVSVTNPTDVEIDIGEDGLNDFTTNGVLNSAESGVVQLPPNSTNVSISTSNNIPIRYSFSWNASAVINNPVVDIEGDVVVSENDTFVEPRTYEVGKLPQGEHTFRFQAKSGGYEAVIEWNEQKGASFPKTFIDNKLVCEPEGFVGDQTCTVESKTARTPGTHTIEFEDVPSESFRYQIAQDARAVADEVSIEVNGQEVARFFRPTVEPKPWEQVEQTTAFGLGDNNVNVSVAEQNGVQPEVNAQVRYVFDTGTVDNLSIRVVNGNGNETIVEIPESSLRDGKLVSDTSVNIPRDALSVGKNKIVFDSNGGVFEMNGNLTISENDSIRFKATR